MKIEDLVTDDIVVNDSSFLHWFLGDGSVSKVGDGMYLPTMGFDIKDIVRLRKKLLEYGLDSSIRKDNNIDILKTAKSVSTIKKFLNKSDYPDCYSYKFDRLKLWLNKFRG